MDMRRAAFDPDPWPWVGQPRVLIEHSDDVTGLALASVLRGEGYAVAVCPGPAESERCPLAGPEGCAIAHGADVVVTALGLERPAGREVLEALRARLPGTPLVVAADSVVDPDWLRTSVREALAERAGDVA
jgi:CheY-like chemotaxis protein